MEPRMLLREVNPAAFAAMVGLEKFLDGASLDKKLKELVKIRASQLNSCAFCLHIHATNARKLDETDVRIYTINAWRDTPYFTPKERAALALTEAVTLVASHHVPDDVYEEAARHFSEQEISELLMTIITINAWNRIAITTGMTPPA
ncbi:alkylhydroperoxidase AhpD family core domain-containing protein [Paenibacillus sp. UNCCL117]|uniref:carboxymuconolactone decarboxylase family protein n=1 Tax=unclassified Paenibacillus TaxID=185978 RepID=UPI000880AB46|nr:MULTISPECIES: carboxymuconolactone decarboxylase family protein [unclassified Paenibacillus]SDE38723.1 alkylhydroperoxidase AhpD family core domain-containing protein [Paenibacillus sp. cl123]SFW65135.1 alkylhydroperoxidase AhpD family core domain-containing protein [Paenibacillus sp. UNCCL117]